MSLRARVLRVIVLIISMFIVLNFDVITNIVYAIVRLLRCSVPKEIVFVHVFLYDVGAHFTCSDFADSSLAGGCA